MDVELIISVVERVRDALNKRGIKTIRSLIRSFRNFDSFDGSNFLSRRDFQLALQESGVNCLNHAEWQVSLLTELDIT